MSNTDLETVIDEAAQWMMRLNSGLSSDDEQRAFEQWKAHNPRHAQVFEQMSGQSQLLRSEHLRGVSGDDLIRTLGAPSGRRRFLRASLGLFGVGLTTLLLARWTHPGPSLSGDLRTAIAERKTFRLDDGSELTLNADSRVTPNLTATQRSLQLHRGMLLVRSVDSPRGPLLIEAGHIRLSATSGLMNIGLAMQQLHLSVLESSVQVTSSSGQQVWVEAGYQALINASGLISVSAGGGNDSAWLRGFMEVDNQPLGSLIEALRAYRHGVLSLDKGAAQLRVSGIFALDDSDRTLRQLANVLPIKVERYSDLWVRIRLA